MTDEGQTLRSIASRVERLSPCHRHPERFEEEKDEITQDLRRVAAGLAAGLAGSLAGSLETRRG